MSNVSNIACQCGTALGTGCGEAVPVKLAVSLWTREGSQIHVTPLCAAIVCESHPAEWFRRDPKRTVPGTELRDAETHECLREATQDEIDESVGVYPEPQRDPRGYGWSIGDTFECDVEGGRECYVARYGEEDPS